MALVIGDQPVKHRGARNLLQFTVDRGVDLVAVVVSRHAIAIQHFLSHHLRRVMSRETQLFAMMGRGVGFSDGCGVLCLVDVAQITHSAENPVAPLFARRGATDRVVARGCLGNPRQHRVLGEIEIGNAFAVIDLCRRLEAVGSMTQENPVEIEFENLALVQCPFDLYRQQDFIELAHESALETEEVVSCDLHGQGTAARALFPRQHQLRDRPQQPRHINPGVAEEVGVLGRQQGLDKLGWYFLKRQRAALLLAKLADQLPVTGIHPHGGLQFYVAQGRDIR